MTADDRERSPSEKLAARQIARRAASFDGEGPPGDYRPHDPDPVAGWKREVGCDDICPAEPTRHNDVPLSDHAASFADSSMLAALMGHPPGSLRRTPRGKRRTTDLRMPSDVPEGGWDSPEGRERKADRFVTGVLADATHLAQYVCGGSLDPADPAAVETYGTMVPWLSGLVHDHCAWHRAALDRPSDPTGRLAEVWPPETVERVARMASPDAQQAVIDSYRARVARLSTEPLCSRCHRHPVKAKGLCSACYEYQRRHRVDRPERFLARAA